MSAETILIATLAISAIWSIICRVRYMDPKRTKWTVFIQHAALAMGLFGSLVLPHPHGKLGLVAGVFVFLLLSANRWKYGAPAGTDKLSELDLNALRHVAGGVKK